MATLTIRNLDDAVRDALRKRAASNGRSMEAEIRKILESVINPQEPTVAERLGKFHAGFRELGGVDELELPPREPPRDLKLFEDE